MAASLPFSRYSGLRDPLVLSSALCAVDAGQRWAERGTRQRSGHELGLWPFSIIFRTNIRTPSIAVLGALPVCLIVLATPRCITTKCTKIAEILIALLSSSLKLS